MVEIAEFKFPVDIKTMRWQRPRLNVHYPLVAGLLDQTVQHNINQRITHTLSQMIVDQGYYENQQTEITGTYEIKTNERGVLSLTLEIYSFSGGAHGLTVIKSLTFDIQTGKLYQLSELFKSGTDYVKRLSDIVKLQILQRKIPLLVEFKGINPEQDYYIADKSLVIYFQLYELTAYVYGFTYFPISVYEIEDILDEDGLLGRMIY